MHKDQNSTLTNSLSINAKRLSRDHSNYQEQFMPLSTPTRYFQIVAYVG